MTEIPKSMRLMTNKDIVDLGSNIITWSLKSASQISDAWGELTGEVPMSIESNLVVRSEMLWFFLHIMDRFSFAFGGPDVRATLQDAIVVNAINTMLTVSFQSGHDKKGFEQWINDMSSAGLEEFNNAGMDYGSYKTLGIEKAGDFAKEDSVIGKLATRIERSTGKGNNLNLRLLVWSTVAEPLPELIKQVKKASQTAR